MEDPMNKWMIWRENPLFSENIHIIDSFKGSRSRPICRNLLEEYEISPRPSDSVVSADRHGTSGDSGDSGHLVEKNGGFKGLFHLKQGAVEPGYLLYTGDEIWSSYILGWSQGIK